MKKYLICLSLITLALASCETKKTEATNTQESTQFQVDYESYTLENGLTVILHKDSSDPVVAVALTAHVGSAREKEGRTGFAHLFEHLLFLESENLGKGGLDKMSARVGGSGANGSTNRDRTNYFQTVPNDALEKMIWAEADKLGYFINTVTEPVLAKEKQVVKNEKRQSYDNRPYGHQSYVIHKNLYPKDHPYNWQVIGSLEDLQNATLADVKEFYNRWYVPNNVTLTIAGDFDTAEAKKWIEKYFGEIPKGEEVTPIEKRIPVLTETKNLYYEDNFARLPQLTMTWPAAAEYTKDSYALEVLANYLSNGKKAPLNTILVDDLQIASNPSLRYSGSELSGEITLSVRANAGVDLDSVQIGIEKAFSEFEKNGIADLDLERIKATQETRFYNSLSSVLGKGFQLAQYQIFAGNPGYINDDLKQIQSVTVEDVKAVYETYIKNKNYITTSFVPKGEAVLALANAYPAEVEEEQIVNGAEETFDPSLVAEYDRTPSSFDRSIEPEYGKTPQLKVPDVWMGDLENGLKIYGIENTEVPLVNFSFTIEGGLLTEASTKGGVANLTAGLLTKGTQSKTTAELEEALDLLGASIFVRTGQEATTLTGITLARNFDKTMSLVSEILVQPRWDSTEFELEKKKILTRLEQQKGDPGSIADLVFAKAVYGKDHVLAKNNLGTTESVKALQLKDLKDYYATLVPNLTRVEVVGNLGKAKIVATLYKVLQNWKSKEITISKPQINQHIEKPIIYFLDVPNAKQSQLRFGYLALAASDPDYLPAQMMNYRLGGGGFASELTQMLRETKGYTYGVRSRFDGSALPGPFMISSGVRSNVTAESTQLVRNIMNAYAEDFNEKDLEITKGYFLKSGARNFETPSAKLGYLDEIATLNFKPDYILKQQETIKNITLSEIKALAKEYVDPSKLIYVIVGDAKTQLKKVQDMGLEVQLVDENLELQMPLKK
ncbi:M16 family metallopeptidase [Leeuwenhoekiella sp. W20_SRS_FM14]|uniref:M16 family metallopeptidase n=1 Tax=Leeuwenhoekiella sp. W20_SRS_FM14 TaxID=3240270 RepID=UPI003F9EA2C1